MPAGHVSTVLDGIEGRGKTHAPTAAAILAEQVRLLHENALLSQIVALICAGILAMVQWLQVDRVTVLAWLACIATISLLRLLQARAFARVKPPAAAVATWRNRFLLGAAVSGALWGAAGIWFFPDSLPHQVFTAFVVAGMVAGSVATLAAVLSAFLLFAVPAGAPIVLQFLIRGGELYFPMGVMAFVYSLVMLAIAKQVNATVRTSLGLSHANSELVSFLTQANSQAESLNRNLQAEIRERSAKEQALRAIATGGSLSEVLDLLCRTIEERMPGGLCSVLLLDEQGLRLHDAAAPSLPRSYRDAVDGVVVGPSAGSCGTAASSNEQVVVGDIALDPLWDQYREVALAHGLRACWSTPIPGSSRPVLGTFAIYYREPRTPTQHDSAVIAWATNVAKIAIERHEAERRIRQLAHFDELTGLPNRVMFAQALERALRHAERVKGSLALLFVDLDRFKNINDTLGHDAGDRLLCDVALRLQRCLRDSDMVARFGGDEFIVLIEDLPDSRHAGLVAEKLLEALARPFTLDGQELHVTGSIGISTFPDDARDAQTLQKNADIAMYRAKERGSGNFHYYSPQANVHSVARLTLEAQLRRAVERDELVLHYQPKQEIGSGRVTGVEALVRWQHPELGMVPPGRFIPLAEETGLIVPIGEWVLRNACRQMGQLSGSPGAVPLRVAVNLSARQLADDRLVGLVSSALDDSRLDVSGLELEITESMVMHNADNAVRLLSRLKEMGVHLAMDDFGTGYSSLAYLKRFPIDSIKIDRSFIHGVPDDAGGSSLTRAIIAMAHSLRLRTVAEGVENAQQLAFLRNHQCDEIQGYFFCHPLPVAELMDKLQAYARAQDLASQTRSAARARLPAWL